jgi:hypothetical protein
MRPKRSPRALLILAVPSIAALLHACSAGDGGRAAPTAVSAGAVVFSPSAGSLAPSDAKACERMAAEMIARLPKIAVAPSPSGPPTVDVTGIWENTGGEVVLSLEGKVRSSTLRVPVGTHVVASGRAGDRDGEIAIVSRGLGDLGRALGALFSLYGGDEAAWIRSLDAAEADEQVLALGLLGDARSRAAIPAIGRALKDPRERVAEAAADALVAIGDESAVPVLIGAIGRDDLRSEVRAIEAISKIGGKEARAYLEMTAAGHEIPEVRTLSQSALERMASERRKAR